MKRMLCIILTAMLLLLSGILIVTADTVDSTITGGICGKVTAGGATIILRDSNKTILDTFITGNDGKYIFENVQAGTGYEISASKTGYLPGFSDNIEVIEGEITELPILVMPIKEPPLPRPTNEPTQPPLYYYDIDGLSLQNVNGVTLEAVPEKGGFIVDVQLKKTIERDATDYLFTVVYDIDGELLSIDYVKTNFSANSKCSFGFYIPRQQENIGSIKAYVWHSFDDMSPLAESKVLTF